MAGPWYAHYPGDYERKTSHLTMLEDGAYRRMLDHYYATATPLPLSADHLYRICRAFADEERVAIDAVLKQFFVRKRDGYHNKRADEEIAKSLELGEKRRKAANSRYAKAPAIADHLHTPSPSPSPSPSPGKKEESKKEVLNGNGFRVGTTSIENPHERIARFQQKIAQALGPTGWETVTAACTRSDPKHEASLALCKQIARVLKKGWPRTWPIQ